jgi:DNA-binding LytR/AlgR family response regulator
MTENAVHGSPMAPAYTPKEAGFGARHRRGFIIAAIVGFLLAMVGALETTEIPFLPRLVYWEILMMSGALIGLGVSEMVEKWGRLRSRQWAEMPLIATLIALPLTLMVLGTSSLFFNTRQPTFDAFAVMFAITFTISLVMTALNYFIHWPGKIMPETGMAPANIAVENPAPSKLSARLPMQYRQLEIVALEAEDHYLRVHFSDGASTLILMRLSDAIGELPYEIGAQTHRSWWVAKKAVGDLSKGDGRATLILTNGVSAPVSRSFYKRLNDEGWFI